MFTLLVWIAIVILLIATIVRGAPPVPTSKKALRAMVELAGPVPGEKVVDLGAGDGRVVIAFARAGADTTGYEINPLLVLLARYNIRKADVERQARVRFGNFWRRDMGAFNIVTVFGAGHIMKSLAKKLRKELPDGARVVSYAFPLPGWQATEERSGVHLYVLGESAPGAVL